MTQIKHKSPPRLWVVGVTCLFAFSVYMATLIILRMYVYWAGETAPPGIWGAGVGIAALFGLVFFSFYLDCRRLKRKARAEEMKDDSSKRE